MTRTEAPRRIHQIRSLIGPLALLIAASCSSPRPEAGTNTNWVDCGGDSECSSGQRCVARRCVSSEIASAEAGNAVVPTDAGPPIQVDCRPQQDIVGSFDSQCQYIGGNLPILSCPETPVGAPSVGAFRLTVEHPERIAIGRPVVLDGADPDVTFGVAFSNRRILVQTSGGPASGTVVFDALRIGEILAGRLVDVRLTFQPDPPFTCTIKDRAFIADWGPGVRDQ